MHDLIHSYARELASHTESEAVRDEMIDRLHEHYAHSADAAVTFLCAHHRRETKALRAGVRPEAIADHAAALAWFTAHCEVLIALLDDAVRRSRPFTVWYLGFAVSVFLDLTGRWPAFARTGHLTLTAARQTGNPIREQHALRLVARGYLRVGDPVKARDHYQAALRLADEVDDPASRAATLYDLGLLLEATGAWADALDQFLYAFQLFRELDHQILMAGSLNAIGWCRLHLGDPHAALDHCREALAIYESSGDRHGQSCTWDSMGSAYHMQGKFEEPKTAYRTAVAFARQSEDSHLQATVLEHLAESAAASGDAVTVRVAVDQALKILDVLDPTQATDMRIKWEMPGAATAPR